MVITLMLLLMIGLAAHEHGDSSVCLSHKQLVVLDTTIQTSNINYAN
jgi:hypothetical protein